MRVRSARAVETASTISSSEWRIVVTALRGPVSTQNPVFRAGDPARSSPATEMEWVRGVIPTPGSGIVIEPARETVLDGSFRSPGACSGMTHNKRYTPLRQKIARGGARLERSVSSFRLV